MGLKISRDRTSACFDIPSHHMPAVEVLIEEMEGFQWLQICTELPSFLEESSKFSKFGASANTFGSKNSGDKSGAGVSMSSGTGGRGGGYSPSAGGGGRGRGRGGGGRGGGGRGGGGREDYWAGRGSSGGRGRGGEGHGSSSSGDFKRKREN